MINRTIYLCFSSCPHRKQAAWLLFDTTSPANGNRNECIITTIPRARVCRSVSVPFNFNRNTRSALGWMCPFVRGHVCLGKLVWRSRVRHGALFRLWPSAKGVEHLSKWNGSVASIAQVDNISTSSRGSTPPVSQLEQQRNRASIVTRGSLA